MRCAGEVLGADAHALPIAVKLAEENGCAAVCSEAAVAKTVAIESSSACGVIEMELSIVVM